MGIITELLKDMPLSAVLRERLKELEKKYSELETENAKLKQENEKLRTIHEEPTKISELNENEVKILVFLSSCRSEPTEEIIAGYLGLSLTKTKYFLERMWDKYLYSHDYYDGKPSEYYLLQKGREYLIENNLIE